MQVSLCLLTWNELEGCIADVPLIARDDFFEVFAVDGGSTDGTVQYLESQGITVHQQTKRGLNAAYVEANRLAQGEAVVVFFPKGTTPVSDATQVARKLTENFDVVIASRQIAGSRNEEDSKVLKPRKWAVRVLAIFVSIIWRQRGTVTIYDVLHGFKGWKKAAFEKMDILDEGLSIDLEMVVRGYKLGLPMIEIPTSETPRFYGESHFSFWSTGRKLLRYLKFEFGRVDSR